MKIKIGEKTESKRIKKILNYDISENSKLFDVLYIVDATGSMMSYITAAKEETKNIANQLKKTYQDMKFKYGYIFYRDPSTHLMILMK